ncbi:MAG: DegV family protein [Candidatus Pacebacteria bacterium]|nr:DegV family protein [Candidatus Paceibacterota bacterium]
MDKLTILLGESAPITQELKEKYGFVVVPFVLDWPDGENLQGNNIFEKMREAQKINMKATPKTSQPSIGTYKKAFEEALATSECVLAIAISSVISGTYNSAIQAKKMFPEEDQKRIYIFDTFNADAAESLFAIKAAQMAQEGRSMEEIFKKLEELKPAVKLFGLLESPYWLEAGGRISHAVSVLMSQMQKIGMRPLLSIVDGAVKPVNLKMQAKDTAGALFKQLESDTKKPLEESKKITVVISHANNLPEAEKLRNLITEKYPQIEILFSTLTGPVIGAHVGPGALICCYMQD